MIQKVYDAEYEKRLAEAFDRFMPEKIYDAHFHISRGYKKSTGYIGTPYGQYTEFNKKYLNRKISGGLIMPNPCTKNMSKEQIEGENNYNLFLALQNELDAGLVVSPIWTREYVEGLLTDYPCIKALKPYLTHARSNQPFESDILDFAPELRFKLSQSKTLSKTEKPLASE